MQKSQLIKTNYKEKIEQTDGVYMDAQVFEDILRATIYVRGYAYYLVFCDAENANFITWNCLDERWSGAYIYNLKEIDFIEDVKYLSDEAAAIGDEYFRTIPPARYNHTALCIMHFQDTVKPHERRYAWSERQIKYLLEKDVGEFPELDFTKFLKEKVFESERYGFYEPLAAKDEIKITCTYCGCTSTIKRPNKGVLNGKNAVCPCCMKKVMLRVKSRMTKYCTCDRNWVALCEKVPGHIRTKYFKVEQIVTRNQKVLPEPEYRWWIEGYNLTSITKTHCQNLEHHHVNSYWNNKSYITFPVSPYTYITKLYPNNLEEVLKNTEVQYGGLWLLAEHLEEGIDIKKYFTYGYDGVIEKLVKVGMYRAAEDCVRDYLSASHDYIINKDSNTLTECIRVSKEGIRILSELNASGNEICAYKGLVRNGEKVSLEFMRTMRSVYKNDEHIYDELSGVDFYDEIAGIKPERAIRYIAEKKITSNLYTDYIKACRKLGYNLTDTKIAFPHSFMERHDSVIMLLDYEENADKIKKIAERYWENIYDYYYEDGDLFITVPKDLRDFKDESNALGHCLARLYVDKYAEGKTTIVFVREKSRPFTPFYTAELHGTREIQLRGDHNKPADKRVREFFDKYLKQLQKKKGKVA